MSESSLECTARVKMSRNHVLPDDVQAVLLPVAGHRLKPARGAATNHRARAELVAELQKAVAIP